MRVGDRIVLQGTHRGTIRYIGSVPNQAGEWTGVEWDDASRGKHDGCVAGQRLFTCQRPGTPATFVRSRKLVESLLPVMSLLEGLRERYCRDEAPSLDLPSPGQHPKGRGVVVMGRADLLAAASDLTMLAHASVLGMHVAARVSSGQVDCYLGGDFRTTSLQPHRVCSQYISQDPPDDLSQALPSLQDLDAGDTLLGSWHAAATALSSLPALRTLSLAGTRLEAVPALPPPPPLPALRTLVLSSTGVGWGGALRIGRSLPSLAALCLCDESVEDVSPAEKGECDLTATFPALESLDLSGNLLASWRQVAALATLPSLQTLNLTGNPWGSSGDDSDCAVPCPPGFRTLRTLLLGGTRVSSWSQVQALDGLPALASLRLTDTPLWTRAPATARAQTIARLGGLVQLNGSQVAAEERRDAELWYLRKVTGGVATGEELRALNAAELVGGRGWPTPCVMRRCTSAWPMPDEHRVIALPRPAHQMSWLRARRIKRACSPATPATPLCCKHWGPLPLPWLPGGLGQGPAGSWRSPCTMKSVWSSSACQVLLVGGGSRMNAGPSVSR